MDEWQVGDLALCVTPWEQWRSKNETTPRPGSVHQVIGIIHGVEWLQGTTGPALVLDGVRHMNPCGGVWHGRFRRIPPHEADAEDAETIRLLTGAPVTEPS